MCSAATTCNESLRAALYNAPNRPNARPIALHRRCKASDAVKLAAIHYYVWHGPYDEKKEQFSLNYMRELRLGEQLMPTPLVTAQVRAA